MGSRSTKNSLQTAPVYQMAGGESGSSTSTSLTGTSLDDLPPTTSQAVVPGGEGGISPALASLIAQTVQAALAAERAAHRSPPVSTTPPQSTSVWVPNSSVPVSAASSCFGGVPSSLGSSASNFLAAGTGLSQPGRPAFSLNMVVPSFVSTFANPSLSTSVSSPSVYSLQNGATRDVADRSAVLALPLLDQPFIAGPGFSPVPAKLVAQIVAGKYIDLSDLLAVNLVQREPEPQLLFDGRLVLTSQPKKQRRRIEDIASWMEAFAIFSLILVSHFPTAGRILCSTSCWSWKPIAIFPAEFGSRMIKLSVSTPPLRGSPTGLPVSDICRLQTADCRLQTADYGLQTTDYRLHTMDLGP